MRILGQFEGATVGVEWRDGHQRLVFSVPASLVGMPQGYAVHGLVQALGLGRGQPSAEPGATRWEIVHDDEVDWRLLELIDLLIAFRFEHPTMIQLPLVLSDEETAELTRAIEKAKMVTT